MPDHFGHYMLHHENALIHMALLTETRQSCVDPMEYHATYTSTRTTLDHGVGV